MQNKAIIFLILLISFPLLVAAEIKLPNQEKVDAALTEYHRFKNTDPQEADKFLRQAADDSYWSNDLRPTLIIRTAWQENRRSQGWGWSDSTVQYEAIDALAGVFAKNFEKPQSYGLTILEAATDIRLLDYSAPGWIPFPLVRATDILENIPVFTPDLDLQPYYDLLPYKINGENHKDLQKQLEAKLKIFKADDWLYAGVRAICDKQSERIVDRIISHLRKIDPAGTDALQAYRLEKRGNLSEEEFAQVIRLYTNSAAKGNVLGACRYADYLLQSDPDKAVKVLNGVENHEHFPEMTGTLVKGEALMHRKGLEDIRMAAHLIMDAVDNCYDGTQRKYAKKLYSKCLDKLIVLELEELERGFNPGEVTGADLSALAAGYQAVKGYHQKAVDLYYEAAQKGDIAALCRVCLRLMEVGIAKENEEQVTDAANTILELAESNFLPFRFNAACILLFGLNGKEPSKEDLIKGVEYYDEFRTKYPKDPQKSLYDDAHFFNIKTITRERKALPKEDQEVKSYFFWHGDALESYNYALKNEREGNYEEARRGYSEACDYGHPFGEWKKRLMTKKLEKKK